MNYFCEVNIQAKKDQKTRTFIVLPASKGDIPNLTKEILIENNQYKIFVSEKKAKLVNVVYKVYSTEEQVYANTQEDVFIDLIDKGAATYISGSDFNVDVRSKVSKKGKKSSFGLKLTLIVGLPVFIFAGLYIGFKYGFQTAEESNKIIEEPSADENIDGMMIPVQQEESSKTDVQQITVSIDRSYSAVPKEDIQLKGDVIEGYAEITLPEFDREDFFSHVPGYTFGFSTVPDSDKIEFYGGKKYKFAEDTKLYRVLVKYGGGRGTKEDPYLINYYDQLELMAEEKARGYFKQTCDITFPDWATHNPIDTVNKLKESPDKEHFEYDGGGYLIENLDNPLFGKVSGAVITNVNIKNSSIRSSEYKYYGFIACEVYNYQYPDKVNKKNFETGETIIKHCTVSNSGIHVEYPESEVSNSKVVVTAHEVVPPDKIEYDDKGNPVTTSEAEAPRITQKADYAIGSITGLGGQIEDCYVYNVGLSCDIEKYYLYAGGISGKPANVINSAVNTFSAAGNLFYAGGISGSAGGARKYNALGEELPDYYGGNIQGCCVLNAGIRSEYSAGGIAGEATTNAADSIISNCYTHNLTFSAGTKENNVIKKTGFNGGIIGTDGQESNGHTVINTVSPADYKCIENALKSKHDESIRIAPPYAFYQSTILTVLNANSVVPKKPNEIFTGNFVIDGNMSDDSGNLAYPETISDLLGKTAKDE